MIDPLLTARLDVLRRNLSRLADPSWLMRFNFRVPDWLWLAFDATIGKQVRNYQPQLHGIEDLLRKAGENGSTESAALLIQEAWQNYTNVCQQTHEIFEECFAFIGGLTFRNQGLDERICPIADELIRDCSRQSTGGAWESLSVPALSEATGRTLARIIRLRFQEWTIWTLPFTAHEFGHVVISEDDALQTFIEDELNNTTEHDPSRLLRCKLHFNEFLADAFATYTMGPAYACAAIMLRFNPLIASREDDASPSYGKRAQIVLSILEQMNNVSDLVRPYEGMLNRLKRTWEEEIAITGSSSLPSEENTFLINFCKRALNVFKVALTSAALYPPTTTDSFRTEGWDVARAWNDKWSDELAKSIKPLTIPRVSATHKFRDVFNAAWLCRIAYPEHVDVIAKAAQDLCDNIIKTRIKAEPSKKHFYQAVGPRK